METKTPKLNEIQAGKSIHAYLAQYCEKNTIPLFTIFIHYKKDGDEMPWTAVWQNGAVNETQRIACRLLLQNVISKHFSSDNPASSIETEEIIIVVDGIEKKLAMAILATMLYGLEILPRRDYDTIRSGLNAEHIFNKIKPLIPEPV